MNFNKIHKLKSNNLFKIFLLMSLFFMFKTNKKIAIILLILVGFFYLTCSSEDFTKSTLTLDQVLNNIDTKKLRFSHYIDIIKFEELCYKILNKAKKDKKLLEIIRQKAIQIYGEINKNKELANYLKFNNLINGSNLPVFINESPDVYLLNEIKIIILTMDKNDFENILI
jgi:hypothetical protein